MTEELKGAYVLVEMTRRMVVKITDPDRVEALSGEDVRAHDVLDYEDFERWLSRIGDESENIEHDYSITVVESPQDALWYGAEPLDENGPTQMLWRAARNLSDAYNQLGRARYREGHCPELDAMAGDIERLRQRLVKAALEVDDLRRDGGTGVIHKREQPALNAPVDPKYRRVLTVDPTTGEGSVRENPAALNAPSETLDRDQDALR